MNKKLRIRKIKTLMKIALIPEAIEQSSDLILNPKKDRNLVQDVKAIPMCDWNDSILLDLTGLIPVAGDAIDVGRSFVYINCGKYLDATIGILCAVPVYGSAIGIPLKGLLKTGAIKSVKDVIFNAIDIIKKYYNESDLSSILKRIKNAVPVIFSNINNFLKGLVENEFVLLENSGKLNNNLKEFEKLLKDNLNFDESAYRKWKEDTLSKSNFNIQKAKEKIMYR